MQDTYYRHKPTYYYFVDPAKVSKAFGQHIIPIIKKQLMPNGRWSEETVKSGAIFNNNLEKGLREAEAIAAKINKLTNSILANPTSKELH